MHQEFFYQEPYGQVLLSRYSIDQSHVIPKKATRLARKLLENQLTIHNRRWHIFNVHLESLPEDGPRRIQQLKQVFYRSGLKDNVIVIGDFNFSDGQQPETGYLRTDFIDAWRLIKPSDPGYTYIEAENGQRLDRILLRCRACSIKHTETTPPLFFNAEGETQPLSDHQAVITTIELLSDRDTPARLSASQ